VVFLTVYVDILFLINSLFNAEILILLCLIYSKKVPKMRIVLSSMLGGLFSVMAFIPYLELFARNVANFLVPVAMIYFAFGKQKLKLYIERYITFIALSFILSGAVLFFDLNIIFSLLLPIPLYFAICILRKNTRKKKGTVVLEYKDNNFAVEGFYDSGNMLFSGGMPVILGNDNVFRGLFGCDFTNRNINTLSERFEMRIIPFVSLGKTGTVLGIKLDRIFVEEKEYNNVILAYAGDNFSDDLVLNSIMT